jgi:putative salt-induced outer membrane protein YdiY
MRVLWFGIFILVVAGAVHTPAAAQDGEKELGWAFEAEFASVTTTGNSETRTFRLGSTLRRVWATSELKLEGGGLRSQSSLITRRATGTSQDDFQLQKEKRTETTAEAYYLRAREDIQFSKRFLAFGGVDWLRNTFAGIDSRVLLAVGAGNSWADSKKWRFKTDYGFSYTFEQEVVVNPITKQNFPGIRLAYDLWTQLTGSTEFTSALIADFNLDNTDDIRLDFNNALPISITNKLFLKPQWQLLWRNDPALTEVPLFAPDGTPTGNTVFAPLEKTDNFFTVALVVKL